MSWVSASSPVRRRATAAPARQAMVRAVVALVPLLIAYVALCAVAQPGPEPVRDEPALLAAAERLISDGQWAATGPDPDQRAYLWHGPGLVLVLAPLVALDLPITAIRFLEPLLLGAALVLFHRLLRLRLAARPALAWTLVLGLYGPFYLVLGTVHKEPLAIVLVVAAMLALTAGLAHGRRAALGAAGLALGALAMVRLEYGWVLIALLMLAAAWSLRRRGRALGRRLVAVCAVGLAVCVPWLAYTYRATGQPLYWGSSSGLSLFWMSPTGLPGENGQWHSPVRVRRDPALAAYRPLFRRLDEVHPLESDRVLRRRALANIRARPEQYARNMVANVSRLLFFAPMRSQRAVDVAGCVLFNGLLLVAVAWAAVRLWRRRRAVPPETAPLAVFAALAIAVHLPPSASPRMLLPIVPVLVWLVAQASEAAPTAVSRRRRPR